MDIEELHFKWTYIHLYPLADVVAQSLMLSILEFLKSEIVIELLPKLASVVPKFLISDTVLEFLISDTVPDSLMSNIGPRY